MASEMVHEKIWTDKCKYDDAERLHYENLAKLPKAIKGFVKESIVLAPSITPSAPLAVSFISSASPAASSFSLIPTIPPAAMSAAPIVPIVPTIPAIPTPNISKKAKSSKNALIAQQVECSDLLKAPVPFKETQKTETKEKSSKRNKKAKEAMRQRELMNQVSKEASPPAVIVEVAPIAPVVVPEPIKSPKTKEVKEKINKSDKKRNKKEKEDPQKIEEKLKIENNDEKIICEKVSSPTGGAAQNNSSPYSLASEVAKARQHIKNSLECMDSFLASVPNVEVVNRINSLETANAELKTTVAELTKLVLGLQVEVKTLKGSATTAACPKPASAPAPAPAKAAPVAPANDDSDDGVDLFASDSEGEDEAMAKLKEERVAAYTAKKSKKPALIAKSNIILDVKPWSDDTDMVALQAQVRSVTADGLLWGASKLMPLAYGIHKLQISCVVEDEKISIDWLQEEIEKFEDYVQSVDIAAFNKV